MTCPVCTGTESLTMTRVEDGPRVYQCPACGGRWLKSSDYWRWQAGLPRPLARASTPTQWSEHADPPALKRCPEDGYILARFSVAPTGAFNIEQCRTCSGVWLDGGEWDLLERVGLHDRLHQILDEDWETELRAAVRSERAARQWRAQLGDVDYERMTEIKTWLDAHPRRSELYAFLGYHERAR